MLDHPYDNGPLPEFIAKSLYSNVNLDSTHNRYNLYDLHFP